MSFEKLKPRFFKRTERWSWNFSNPTIHSRLAFITTVVIHSTVISAPSARAILSFRVSEFFPEPFPLDIAFPLDLILIYQQMMRCFMNWVDRSRVYELHKKSKVLSKKKSQIALGFQTNDWTALVEGSIEIIVLKSILSEKNKVEYIEYGSSKYYRRWHSKNPCEENMFDHMWINSIFPSMFLYHSTCNTRWHHMSSWYW